MGLGPRYDLIVTSSFLHRGRRVRVWGHDMQQRQKESPYTEMRPGDVTHTQRHGQSRTRGQCVSLPESEAHVHGQEHM